MCIRDRLCTEDLYEHDEQEIHADFDRKIRTSMEELAGNPLMEGDLVSVDLKTAALVIRFSSDVLLQTLKSRSPFYRFSKNRRLNSEFLKKTKPLNFVSHW